MTEQEAIKEFEERLAIEDYKKDIPEYYKAMEVAISAIEEIQQYRETKKALEGMEGKMSNDLISRGEVLSALEKVFGKYNIGFGGDRGGFAEAVPKAIEAIPTAYDVDKVVERLGEKSISEDKMLYASPDIFGFYILLGDAIEIIKAGGVNA